VDDKSSVAKPPSVNHKTLAANKARKEVEENPFKKLLSIDDLMELEDNQDEVLKEVQNAMLRHNSDMKQWYKHYSRKIEVTKSEESFAMTLKQLWRFMRDTHLISANSTIAQFDRVYTRGPKNWFTLLGSADQDKFDKFYCQAVSETKQEAENQEEKTKGISDDEDEEEEKTETKEIMATDMHDAVAVVLQRQFMEAIVRAASVKYASGGNTDLTSLS